MTGPGGTADALPRPLLHPLLRSLLFVAAFLAVQGIAIRTLEALLRDGAEAGRAGVLRTSEALLFLYAASLPGLLLLTWAFLRLLDRRSFRSIGLRLPRGGARAALVQALTAPFGATALLAAWLAALLLLPDSLARFRAEGLAPGFRSAPSGWLGQPALLLGLLFLGFCVQGGIEEWVLRGYVYRALRERWAPWRAALASALLFSALHATNPSVSPLSLLNIALAGFLLAGLVERTGSLWSPALAHGAWNFAVACLLSLPVSGFSMTHLLEVRIAGEAALTGGGFGPEGSLLLTPLAALASWGVWHGRRREACEAREAPEAPEAPEAMDREPGPPAPPPLEPEEPVPSREERP